MFEYPEFLTRRQLVASILGTTCMASSAGLFAVADAAFAASVSVVPVNAAEAQRQINMIRRRRGAGSVEVMEELQRLAISHSLTMARKGKMAHHFGRGTRLPDRLSGVVDFSHAAENVGAGYQSLESVLDGWVKSRGHRKNLLNRNYSHFGIGRADTDSSAARYKTYWTLILVRPR